MTHQEIRQHLEKALACCNLIEGKGHSGGKKHSRRAHGHGYSGGSESDDDSNSRRVGFEELHRQGGVEPARFRSVMSPMSLFGGKKHSKKKGRGTSGGGTSGGSKKKKVNKRALIVKKVMKEHGYSMIEASKYVKQHGLY